MKTTVEFLVYHQAFNAHPGAILDVDAEWARRAIAAGIVRPAPQPTPAPAQEGK